MSVNQKKKNQLNYLILKVIINNVSIQLEVRFLLTVKSSFNKKGGGKRGRIYKRHMSYTSSPWLPSCTLGIWTPCPSAIVFPLNLGSRKLVDPFITPFNQSSYVSFYTCVCVYTGLKCWWRIVAKEISREEWTNGYPSIIAYITVSHFKLNIKYLFVLNL